MSTVFPFLSFVVVRSLILALIVFIAAVILF